MAILEIVRGEVKRGKYGYPHMITSARAIVPGQSDRVSGEKICELPEEVAAHKPDAGCVIRRMA
jgi:hypothetical protein